MPIAVLDSSRFTHIGQAEGEWPDKKQQHMLSVLGILDGWAPSERRMSHLLITGPQWIVNSTIHPTVL